MTDDNKQLNKIEQMGDKSTQLSVSDITVFKDNPHLVYLYKKTEKLVSALYMLSNFISDKEPIKWQMREAGIELLSHSLSLSDRLSSGRVLAYSNFISTALKFLSILEVSYLGGIISEMNYKILKHEFESLIQTAEAGGKGSDTQKLIFPDQFFKIPAAPQNVTLNSTKNIASEAVINKGQSAMSDRPSRSADSLSVRNKRPVSETSSDRQSYRQDIIIALLKKNKELGIKDFTSSVKDCSEKTIQRELATLVSKGLIIKEGEKRWSRYSLK